MTAYASVLEGAGTGCTMPIPSIPLFIHFSLSLCFVWSQLQTLVFNLHVYFVYCSVFRVVLSHKQQLVCPPAFMISEDLGYLVRPRGRHGTHLIDEGTSKSSDPHQGDSGSMFKVSWNLVPTSSIWTTTWSFTFISDNVRR